MPWTYENPPSVAENWTDDEIRACVDAANAVLDEGGSDEDAIYACIHAAGKERAMGMKQKVFRAPIELKADGDEGTFKSIFARFNVVDLDGDVTLPGAFRNGQEVVVEGWNHDYTLPPGKGVIHSNDEEAWIDGRFFLDTTPGKDTYRTLKNLEGLEEWSYTFDIEEADRGTHDGEDVRLLKALDVWGVAPVTRGAGIGTRTVALKGASQFTDEEVDRLKAFLKEQDTAGEDGGSEGAGGEGEAGEGGPEGPEPPDGNQSGGPPGDALVEIDMVEVELS